MRAISAFTSRVNSTRPVHPQQKKVDPTGLNLIERLQTKAAELQSKNSDTNGTLVERLQKSLEQMHSANTGLGVSGSRGKRVNLLA